MTADALLQFDYLSVHKTYYEPGLHMPWHTDDVSRISIVLTGESREKTPAGGETRLAATALVTKPNNALHETTFGAKGCTILSVQFADDSLFPAACRHWATYQHPRVALLGLQLWAGLKAARHDHAVATSLAQLTGFIHTLQDAPPPPARLAYAAAVLASAPEEGRSVQHLAGELALHRAYLSRVFKHYYHLAPTTYSQQHRVLRAVAQLSQPVALAAVAYVTGYADQSHLNRAIRQAFGCTPQALRSYLH